MILLGGATTAYTTLGGYKAAVWTNVLKSAFRGEDVVTRFGGDEFAILLPGTDDEAVAEAMARLRHGMAAYNALHSSRPLTISLGSATAQTGPLADALKEADRRMYQEKALNRLRETGT